jgi:hypothetical protein
MTTLETTKYILFYFFMRLGKEKIDIAEPPAELHTKKRKKIAKRSAEHQARLELNAEAKKWGDLIFDSLEDSSLKPQEVYNLFNAKGYTCLDFSEEAENENQNIALNVENAIRTKAVHFRRFEHLFNCSLVASKISEDIKSGRVLFGRVLKLIGVDFGVTTKTPLDEAIKILKQVLIEDRKLHVEALLDFVKYNPVKVNMQGLEGENFINGMGDYGQIREIAQDFKLDFQALRLPILFEGDIVDLDDGTSGIISGFHDRVEKCVRVTFSKGEYRYVSPKNITNRRFQE